MKSNRFPTLAAASLAGALVAFALPPWGWWPLALIGVALFMRITVATTDVSSRMRFALGFIFAVSWFAPGMGWMWFLTPPGYVIAVVLFSSFHGFASIVGARSRLPIVGIVLAHTLAETLRMSFPFGGVPLASLAIATASSPLSALSSISGPLFVTLVIWTLGAIAATSSRATSLRNGVAGLSLVAALLVLTVIGPHAHDLGATKRIAAVQGGGPQGTLAINTNPRDVVDRHLAATRTLTESGLDMVIWPENVIDVEDFYTSVEREEIAREASRLSAPFVVGITEDVDRRYFTNAQVVVNVDGTLADRYDKVRRVPFGEFVPLRGLLEALGAPVDRIPRDAQAGDTPASLRVGDTTAGVVISWEVFFSGRANEGVERDATFIINPTNGSSYTGTILQTQQIASSRRSPNRSGRVIDRRRVVRVRRCATRKCDHQPADRHLPR
ncbi:MAG: apolipoprotein N-acyltransferase [Actinobacteria bacterium]|nr:apolipoprotein N-acyltransferase [Actinomycetota bacterium]